MVASGKPSTRRIPSSLNDVAVCPFEIVVDTNEGHPFSFLGITTGTGEKKKPLLIKTTRKALYAMAVRKVETKRASFDVGLADYTIAGLETQVQIERKSVSDLFSTLGERREKFECEIKRLHEDCRFAAVVVEGGWDAITLWRGHGPTPQSVIGTIFAWQQRYKGVHWQICPNRSVAERFAFRMLERFWEDTTGN